MNRRAHIKKLMALGAASVAPAALWAGTRAVRERSSRDTS